MIPGRRGRSLRRSPAALAGAAILVLAASASLAPATDASWEDAESGSARFTAATVPTPVKTCPFRAM